MTRKERIERIATRFLLQAKLPNEAPFSVDVLHVRWAFEAATKIVDYADEHVTEPVGPTAERLRHLAKHLEDRPCAPSLDGYELVDGLRAAAELLDGCLGPNVHVDSDPSTSLNAAKIPLAILEKNFR